MNNREIKYTLRQSQRAHFLRLTIAKNGNFVATKPPQTTIAQIENFMVKKADWILEHLDLAKLDLPQNTAERQIKFLGAEQFQRLKKFSLRFVKNEVKKINKIYRFSYKKVSVKNHQARWGSCSRMGNLNFNYRICLLPGVMVDYIVAHELCHLRELNHSSRFWSLVACAIPDYLKIKKELRRLKI